jgi:hypothetical protein
MASRYWLFVICSVLWHAPVAATPASQHVPFTEFTRLTLDIVPDYGTQLVFPFVLDGMEPALEINNTNSVGFTASHQTGQNTILVTANTPKAGGPAPDYRGLLFITVGGYRVAIELRTTAHVSKNQAEVIFDLSPERREFLITEAVKRRTAQLDQEYQARVAALDTQVEAKALNLVADLASSRPRTVRVKSAEDKTLNQATVEVYVDAWKVYPSFAILQFELTNRSATLVTVNSARVSRPSDTDGVQVGHGAFTCDRPLQPDATSRCSFTTRDVALVAAERLTLDVDTDRGALSLSW